MTNEQLTEAMYAFTKLTGIAHFMVLAPHSGTDCMVIGKGMSVEQMRAAAEIFLENIPDMENFSTVN
jgi:ribosomal silencing factor RsfS